MSAAGSAEDHLVALLEALSGFAKQQMDLSGGFEPFGAYINRDDELALATAILDQEGADELGPDDPYELLRAVFNGLRDQAQQGAIHAAGYCVNVGLQPTGAEAATDAVRVRIEHVEGLSIEVHYPYVRQAQGGFEWGEPTSQPDAPRIFAGPDQQAADGPV